MPDRMTVITQLGQLIGDAEQRGDDRAAAALRDALELVVSDGANDRALKGRRSSDAQRQRERRERERREREDQNVTLGHVTSRDSRDGSQGFSPTPPFPNSPTQHDTPRASEDDALLTMSQGLLIDRMGPELYADVMAFLERRPRSTWHAWVKEMLMMLNGRAEPADVAAACRDDATLERRVSSAKGFRFFINSAVEERLLNKRRPVGEPRANGAGIGQRAFDSTMAAIKDLP